MGAKNFQRTLQGESGSALLASFMLVFLITGAGLTAMTSSSASQNKSKNIVNSKQASYLAEAALNHGNLYLHQHIANWATYATYVQPQTLVPTVSLSGVGSYTVTVKAASGGALLLEATGTGPNNSTASISTVVALDNGNLGGNAFITGQALTVSGSPVFSGTSGGIHTNTNLTISGSPTIATNAEATGTYTATGSPTVTGFKGGQQPQQTINAFSASDLSGNYDYYFTYCYSDADYTYHGCVYDRNWTLKANVADGQTANINGNTCWAYTSYSYSGGWHFDYTTWRWVYTPYTYTPFIWTATCTPPNATYFVLGDAVISGNIGTVATPWITTILAYGSVRVTSPSLVARPPLLTEVALYKAQTQNLLFVADMDILITGNANQHFGYVDPATGITYGAIISAYNQVGISGDPDVRGYILAQDVSNTGTSYWGTNAVASNYISGNMTLTYNGNLANSSQGNAVTKATLY